MEGSGRCLDTGMPVTIGWCRGKLAGEILRTALTGFLERVCEQANHPVEGEDWEPIPCKEVER